MKPTKEMLEVGAFAAMVSNCCGVMVEGDRVMCDDVRLGDDREERCRCREDFTAGLTAALSALPAGVKVKALDWTEEKLTWNATGPIVPVAHTVLGRYQITELMIGSPAVLEYWVSLSMGARHVGGFDTLEAAKSAAFADYSARILSAIYPDGVETETLETYFERQIEWSRETFGPALRTGGVVDHIRKELREIEADPHDLSEWVDVVILAMDGFWRHGGKATDLLPALLAKQRKNMARTWPDWRTMSEDSAIEHDRSQDATIPVNPTQEGKDNAA